MQIRVTDVHEVMRINIYRLDECRKEVNIMYEPPLRITKDDDSYIPHSDFGRCKWMTNFICAIERAEDRFGIPAEDFDRCKAAVHEFADAYNVVTARCNRTIITVRRKNEARRVALQECRALAMRLKHDPALSASQRSVLGLNIDDNRQTRLKRPANCPFLSVHGTKWGGHEIRFEQRNSASGVTAKPQGCTHLLLFAAIGEGPLPVSEAHLIAGVTRQPHPVTFPKCCGLNGKTITYYARWMNRKGEMGPWSPGVSMILARANGKLEEMESAHVFLPLQKQAARAA